jgi:acyl-CoA dehydrogenase
LAVDVALLVLGGSLKRHEMLSARFGDILSELYLSSAALKRWHDEGRQAEDFPLLEWCMEASFATIEARFDEILANFPNRPVAWLVRFLIQPLGPRRRGPSDRLTQACANIITSVSAARERLTVGLFRWTHGEALALLDRAFELAVAVQPIRQRMRRAHVGDLGTAEREHVITADEAARLREAAEAAAAVIAVDDFAPEELSPRRASTTGDVSSQATIWPPAAAAE